MAATEFCTFRLADLTFGIEVQRVQEVIRPQALTAVPRANRVVEGLINLRGQIVTAIDLRRRLELPTRPDETPGMNVVVRTGDGALSLLVDEIGDVVHVDDAAFETPPDTLDGVARELLTGAYKLEDRLLLILDVDQVVRLPQAS
ncbi:chemotaxis protein CheW [Nitriliruptor alkaliphilus]|uniref:chemotaxis protein CheW n=1 Tax=Nitriliruptor alkaliphilus TaxID=427918 RepID=UPI000695C8EC|nr:chemotaxis protein CheW [Nitriliruptor alkaliphilus]